MGPNFNPLRKFHLTKLVIVLFSFPVILMLSFAVLQGVLDVLQGSHTFHLFFLPSGPIYYITRAFLIWLESRIGALSLLAFYLLLFFSFSCLICVFFPPMADCFMPFITLQWPVSLQGFLAQSPSLSHSQALCITVGMLFS